MTKKFTIVGAGQFGTMIAYHLLKRGKKVKLIDAGSQLLRENQQIPWGWYRKFSLQSEVKKNIMSQDFAFKDFIKKINYNSGPMLISTQNDNTIEAWKNWISTNPESDAKVFLPNESSKRFNIDGEYFKNKGGIFQCDSRDVIFDFSMLNNNLWEFLKNHKDCEIIEDCNVKGLIKNNNKATHIITDDANIPIDKTFFCIGNQTSKILDSSLPVMELTLPYVFCQQIPKQEYAGIWNKYSSLTFFNNSDVKLACGTQSLFPYNSIKFNTLHHFANMGIKGYSNLSFIRNKEYLINEAKKELEYFGVNNIKEKSEIKTCNLDVTPTLCPYVYFPNNAQNILSLSGLSGSGSMALDTNFINLIIKSLDDGKLDNKISCFQPTSSIYENWFPPKEKQTALSSIT
ncbi:hypothetical protein CPAV1605_408 [seawater metagenome]|uniref:FAD dependent oxidoreductase domain-containing protein n=1 Tax=seawater metagenome TaxID=1561972 RepID=A0A5E8CH01_9ZZZZ